MNILVIGRGGMDKDAANKRTCSECLSPKCGAALATAIAEILSEGLSIQQMNVLANFIGAVAQSLSYIAAAQQLCDDTNNTPPISGIIS